MSSVSTSRTINAPVDRVFETIARIENFSQAIEHITNVEFLTEQKHGVGTRFRETRLMNGKEQSVELEVTEYAENDRVRLVSDAGGTIWDTVFTVSEQEGGTLLTMHMDAKAYKLLARLMNPMIMGMVRKAVEKDMDAVKAHCEKA